MRRSKYNNRKVTRFGITFDSIAEANRYLVLRELFQDGEIGDLNVHTKWEILPAFVDCHGKRVRPVYYVDDFDYVRDGHRVVEDVKGHKTAVYVIKSKMFRKRYPDVLFLEVRV